MTAGGPAISVLLPVRDGAAHLLSALRSLRRQSFPDFEICLQDDGSSDATLPLARRVAAQEERLRIQSGPPQGVVAALNQAAARARGQLLVRMDADDLSHPERLARLWALAQGPDRPDFMGSHLRYAPRADVTAGMRRYERWANSMASHADVLAARFTECPVVHGTWAFRPRLWHTLGGYANGPYPEDYDFLLRALASGARTQIVREALITSRRHAHSLSQRDARYSDAAFVALKLRHLVPLVLAEARATWIVGAGPNGKAWARRLKAAGAPLAGFLDPRPGRAGQQIAGLPVRTPGQAPTAQEALLLLCVGSDAVRLELAAAFAHEGRVQGEDWFRLH